jgi:hypothetical protein
MVNVDEQFPPGDARPHPFAQALQTCGVGGDDAVELQIRFGLFDQPVQIEEAVLLRDWILVPARDLLAFAPKRERQGELRADAIAIGPDVADDAQGPGSL